MAGESFFQRLKQGLTKSRENLLQNIGSIFQNRRWDEESLDAMEESLIAADVGVKATDKLMEALRRQSPGGNGDIAEEMSARLQGRHDPNAARNRAPRLRSRRFQRGLG